VASTSSTTTILVTTTTLPEKDWLVIQGTGDVAVDPEYIPALAQQGWDHAWSGLNGLFLEDDLTVINLACVPSELGAALEKAFVFRCPPEALPRSELPASKSPTWGTTTPATSARRPLSMDATT